jgi:hypothetical protein
LDAAAYATVAPIINLQCANAGCHDGQNSPPDLTTETGVDANAAQEASSIAAGTMPKGGTLSASDKATLATYFAGLAGAAGTIGTSTLPGTATAGSVAPCIGTPTATLTGTGTDTVSGTLADNIALFHDSDVQACHAKGLIFNRKTLACGVSKYPASFTCDHQGVLGAYSGNSVAGQILTGYDNKKMTYDQCGTLGSTPVLIAICPTTESGVTCDTVTTCLTEDEVKAGTTLPPVALLYCCLGAACGSM